MMTNLFSIFDTNTNTMYEMNWISSILNLTALPPTFWIFQSKIILMINKINTILMSELKSIFISKFNMINMIFMISLFYYILLNNLMGLFPYIFTSSSHMVFSLSISLPFWLSLMIYGWKMNTNFMFSHMIPQGTPSILMPFMVLIETISNFIRPLTLTIRLTANMIAGHLLLTLLSQSAISPFLIISVIIIMIQMILLTLEISVSIIQSYVFTVLTSLYTKETN